MSSWIFAAVRTAGILTVGMLAGAGMIGVVGFYLTLADIITIDQIASFVDSSRQWHATIVGSYGASIAAVAAHYYRQWRSAENAIAFQSAVQQAVSALVGPVGGTSGGPARGNR